MRRSPIPRRGRRASRSESASSALPCGTTSCAAHAVALRLGTDPSGTDEGGGGGLYLIVAASLEEIAHDITVATRWVALISLMLTIGAGCLAFFPAHLLTRPLDRINRAAQRL